MKQIHILVVPGTNKTIEIVDGSFDFEYINNLQKITKHSTVFSTETDKFKSYVLEGLICYEVVFDLLRKAIYCLERTPTKRMDVSLFCEEFKVICWAESPNNAMKMATEKLERYATEYPGTSMVKKLIEQKIIKGQI